jgi:hypothetical protein
VPTSPAAMLLRRFHPERSESVCDSYQHGLNGRIWRPFRTTILLSQPTGKTDYAQDLTTLFLYPVSTCDSGIVAAKPGAAVRGSEPCLRNQLLRCKRDSSDEQNRGVGTR